MDGEPELEGVEAVRGVRSCPACGARQRRAGARFCATCGRGLVRRGRDGEDDADDYFPSDTLRASYHLQHRGAATQLAGRLREQETARRTGARAEAMPIDRNLNGASTTALAFATYALVPYLGILFCPGALALGGVGYLRSRRAPHLGGRRASLVAFSLGLLLLCAQLFLWWVLYKIPEWTRQP